jgi:hypothetical protein
MKKEAKGDLFDDQGDPFDDPLWKEAEWRAREHEAGLPDGLTRGWLGCSLAWFEWVLPRTESQTQLAIMLLLYRKRLVTGSRTVSLSKAELERFGISRHSMSRALIRLGRSGLLTVQPWEAGKPTKVVLSDGPVRGWRG